MMLENKQTYQLLYKYSEVLRIFYSGVYNSSSKELFAWSSEFTQQERFRVILEEAYSHFELNSTSTLADMGCGHAGLYHYMNKNGYFAEYSGFDFYSEFISECKSRFPLVDFKVYDVLNTQGIAFGQYDVVCMSGVLNLNVQPYVPEIADANFKVLDIVLSRLLEGARKGVVLNLLDVRSKSKNNFFAFFNHEELIKKLKNFGYQIVGFCDGYLPNDFTLSIASTISKSTINLIQDDNSIAHLSGQKNGEKVSIYTDGGCKGNPGIGAWAFYVVEDAVEQSDNELHTTNNKMELMAACKSLEWALCNHKTQVDIYTDSQYVQKGITEWIFSWKKNHWKTSTKQPVKNKDLWIALDELVSKIQVQWYWVKGHDGHEANEIAHELVTKSINALID